jgi:hypothetical protein
MNKAASSLAVLAWFSLGFSCVHEDAITPGRTVIVADAVPYFCKKLGVIEGVGGSAGYAIANAEERAFERGATHVVLGHPELDIDQGLVTVVEAKLYDCPPPGSYFPPTGYP